MPKITKQLASENRRNSVSIVSRIKPIGFDKDLGIKINLYGRSGSGKTTLWSTFPKPILAVICSGGKNPGELLSINTPANKKVIDQVVVAESTEIQQLVDFQKSSGKYKTIVLDHATGLQDLVLKELLGLDKMPEQLSWGLATQQQYGQMALQMKERLRSLLDLTCNVVVIAQEREFNTDNDSELLMPYVASALSPSVVGWLNPAVDYICQTFIRQRTEEKEITVGTKKVKTKQTVAGVDFCLRTAPHATFTTKFRLPKGMELPEVIVDPNYDKIVELIQGE